MLDRLFRLKSLHSTVRRQEEQSAEAHTRRRAEHERQRQLAAQQRATVASLRVASGDASTFMMSVQQGQSAFQAALALDKAVEAAAAAEAESLLELQKAQAKTKAFDKLVAREADHVTAIYDEADAEALQESITVADYKRRAAPDPNRTDQHQNS